MKFDTIIVGCGFAGAVLAERIANELNRKVLIIEKRNHIAGNMYDYEKYGFFVHQYGPHIFHTNNKKVFDYLSQFTEWIPYFHKVLVNIEGNEVPIPFNLNTLYKVFSKEFAKKLEKKLLNLFEYGAKIPILELKKKAKELKDKDLEFLAEYIYKNVFLNYTKKQWDISPENLDGVTERVPILISKDDRYFQDIYQVIPKEGYTKLFEKMINNKNIKVLLKTDYKEIIKLKNKKLYLFNEEFKGIFIYTGPIDYFFDYKYGKLPYRSLKFKFIELDKEFYQSVATVNYPNNYNFTRITEFKHFYKNYIDIKINKTIIVEEYPEKYNGNNEPYYPIPKKEYIDLYQKYKTETDNLKETFKNVNFYFIGRLAEYKYYNMDQIVERALNLFEEIRK